ncbi:MAG: nicotinamide mononucleotide transporter [Bacteroidales bacterium]|nr:nicotinamide mononucleotide transporter [Bacteroidales bacterium]
MDFMEIFTLVTGVIYIILEIRQKNFMWVVGIATSIAAMWVFFRQGLYASFALNTYYLVTSFIGLWQWRRDRNRLEAAEEATGEETIHLNRLSWKTVAVSAVAVIAGTIALAWVMQLLENPMSYMDSAVAVLSAVATWWLVRSYLQQWWIWIAADAMSTVLCATQGLWWMAALYAMYSLSAIYGLIHWKRHGRYL